MDDLQRTQSLPVRGQQVQKPGATMSSESPVSLPPSPPPPQYLPLRAWLYRDGFARFSNTRFTLSSIDDQCILGSAAVRARLASAFPEGAASARLWAGFR